MAYSDRLGDITPDERTVARFSVGHTQYLDSEGALTLNILPGTVGQPDELVPIYQTMVLVRAFDTKAVNLQRTGQLGTYPSNLGQEAVGVAVASAMRSDDVLVPTYREFGAQLWRGVKMEELYLYWGGDERGSDFAVPREDFPISIPIATHTLHAVGVAYAMKLRRQARTVVCFVGDGATSKGDFYEAINAAGVWCLPIVFVVVNNGWAISVPLSKQSAAQTLAQQAFAAGFGGEQVDGNDALAMRAVTRAAIDRARDGGGPHLIEALTYRMSDHTTSDDWRRYRSSEEVEAQRVRDPIKRLRNYLESCSVWDQQRENALLAEIKVKVASAVEIYQATAALPPESMFDHLYQELPASLAWQRRSVAKGGGNNG